MAGGIFNLKSDPKKGQLLKTGFNNNEVLKDSSASKPPQKFSLKGILGLNQPVEIGKKESTPPVWTKESLGVSYLAEQERAILQKKQQELEQSVIELQGELAKLAQNTEGLEKQTENVILENIPEASDYQISFLQRLRVFVANFRKNISEASCWLESFNKKKKKKNCFWNTAKDKKRGGEQYMFSNEHSAARSVN